MLNKSSTCVYLAFIITGCAAEQREQQLNAKISNQSTEMRSLQGRLDDIERRLDKQQDQSADLQQNFKQERADVQVLVDDLRTEVNQLRGSQQEINHNLDLLKVDVQRLRTDSQKSEEKPRALGEFDLYNRGNRAFIEEKDYATAVETFREFLKRYPKSTLAGNAAYLVGEAFYRQGKYKEAIAEYQGVIEGYPKSDKVCRALMGQGMAFEQLKDQGNAKLFYEETISRCKGTQEASRAAEALIRVKPQPTVKKSSSKTKSPKK